MLQSCTFAVHQFSESARQRSEKLESRILTVNRLLLDATLLQVLTEGLLGLPVELSCLAQGRAKASTPRYSALLRGFQNLPALPMKTAE